MNKISKRLGVAALMLLFVFSFLIPAIPGINMFAGAEQETQTIGSLQIGDRVVDTSWAWKPVLTGEWADNLGCEPEAGPVEWIVVDKTEDAAGVVSEVTLLSECLLGTYGFDETEGDEAGTDVWRDSAIRFFLNEEFFDGFSPLFQNNVIDSQIENIEIGYNTIDEVFLLSGTEMGIIHTEVPEIGNTMLYFDDDVNLEDKLLASFKAECIDVTLVNKYWTRSPSDNVDSELLTIFTDQSGDELTGLDFANENEIAFRPALNVSADVPVYTAPIEDGGDLYEIAWPDVTITVTVDPEVGGTVDGGDAFIEGEGTINYHEEVVLTAVPAEGYAFESWTVEADTVSTDNPYSFLAEENKNITANFVEVYELTLSVNPAEGGEASITSDGEGPFKAADIIEISAVAGDGYVFSHWSATADAGSFENENEPVTTFTIPASVPLEDVTVTAHFEKIKYKLTMAVNPEESGTATDITNAGPYTPGAEVSIKAEPAEGYAFAQWAPSAGEIAVVTATETTFTMPAEAVTVTANFVTATYTLNYSAGEGGSITGVTPQTVTHGSDGSEVTAVPDEGYEFTGWSDGVETASRQDTKVTENISVTANFAEEPPGIMLDITELSMGLRDTRILTVETEGGYKEDYKKLPLWESSNADVVIVSAVSITEGEVYSVGEGTATVTVTTPDGKHIAECVVTVSEIPLKDISLDQSQLILNLNAKSELTIKFTPGDATNRMIVWESDDEEIAAVSSEGIVTGVSVGQTMVRAISVERGFVAECEVDVADFKTINPPLVRTLPLLVVLLDFEDKDFTTTEEDWKELIFGNSNSLKSYYQDVSGGLLHIIPAEETWGVKNDGIVKLNFARKHPGTDSEVLRDIVRSAVNMLKDHVNVKGYANSDGFVTTDELHVLFVFADTNIGGAFSSGFIREPDRAWYEFYQDLIDWIAETIFRRELDSVGNPPQVDGITFFCRSAGGSYMAVNEMFRHSNIIFDVGTIAHEMGHSLGLPDLYNTDPDSTDDGGISKMALMSVGNWPNDGKSPSLLSPWSRLYLDIAESRDVIKPGYFKVHAREHLGDKVIPYHDTFDVKPTYNLRHPGNIIKVYPSREVRNQNEEYFLIENRRTVSGDFDKALGNGGIAIWHVNKKYSTGGNWHKHSWLPHGSGATICPEDLLLRAKNQVNGDYHRRSWNSMNAHKPGEKILSLKRPRGVNNAPFYTRGGISEFNKNSSLSSALATGTDSKVDIRVLDEAANTMEVAIMWEGHAMEAAASPSPDEFTYLNEGLLPDKDGGFEIELSSLNPGDDIVFKYDDPIIDIQAIDGYEHYSETNKPSVKAGEKVTVYARTVNNETGTTSNNVRFDYYYYQPVTDIDLDRDVLVLAAGEKLLLGKELNVDIIPEHATNKNLLWESDNEDVVRIENNAIISVSPGTARLTVSPELPEDWVIMPENIRQEVYETRFLSETPDGLKESIRVIVYDSPILYENFGGLANLPEGWLSSFTSIVDAGVGQYQWRTTIGEAYTEDRSVTTSFRPDWEKKESWLVYGEIEVKDGMELIFSEKVKDESHDAVRSIYITKGEAAPGNPDFELLVNLSEIPGEPPAKWNTRFLPIGEYAGETVRVAFVYKNGVNDQWFIDNVMITDVKEPAEMEVRVSEGILITGGPTLGAYPVFYHGAQYRSRYLPFMPPFRQFEYTWTSSKENVIVIEEDENSAVTGHVQLHPVGGGSSEIRLEARAQWGDYSASFTWERTIGVQADLIEIIERIPLTEQLPEGFLLREIDPEFLVKEDIINDPTRGPLGPRESATFNFNPTQLTGTRINKDDVKVSSKDESIAMVVERSVLRGIGLQEAGDDGDEDGDEELEYVILPNGIGFTLIEVDVEDGKYKDYIPVLVTGMGDVKGNGEINIQDAILVLRHLVGLAQLEEKALERALVCGGSDPSVSDAILILRYVVGLIGTFPANS